jgi:hypothetical protein
MRFAFILAFVSSVFFHTATADARPGSDPVAQARTSKGKKHRAHRSAAKAKRGSKGTKASRKAKRKARSEPKTEDVAAADDAEEAAPAREVEVDETPAVKGAAVAQATDDEEPPTQPKKRR